MPEVKKLEFNPDHVVTYGGYHTDYRFKSSSATNLGPVFMVWDEDWTTGRIKMTVDEAVYVIKGDLTLTIYPERGEAEVVKGAPGDLITITEGSDLTYSAPAGTRVLAVISPLG